MSTSFDWTSRGGKKRRLSPSTRNFFDRSVHTSMLCRHLLTVSNNRQHNSQHTKRESGQWNIKKIHRWKTYTGVHIQSPTGWYTIVFWRARVVSPSYVWRTVYAARVSTGVAPVTIDLHTTEWYRWYMHAHRNKRLFAVSDERLWIFQ